MLLRHDTQNGYAEAMQWLEAQRALEMNTLLRRHRE
jgi:hypothetical protein